MFTPQSLVIFPVPCFSRITFANSIKSILEPFIGTQMINKMLRNIQDTLSPTPSIESTIILLKLRAFASKHHATRKMTCNTCMELILGFFENEILGHSWDFYVPYTSPPLDSIGSPALLETGVFREGGNAFQNYPSTASQEVFDLIRDVTLLQPQVRVCARGGEGECILEAVLPEEYLNGIPTVEILRLLLKNAATLRRCRVNPLLGMDLVCLTLDGTLKVDVWRNANTAGEITSSTEFDQCLGVAIQKILDLPRPYDFHLLIYFLVE